VTSAQKESPIPQNVIGKLTSSNTIIDYITKLSEPEEQEESKEEVVELVAPKAECEPDMLLPLLVFLYNAMANRKDLR